VSYDSQSLSPSITEALLGHVRSRGAESNALAEF
jgi:hypothetical protein